MKKLLILTVVCVLAASGSVFAQNSASFSFNDLGLGGGTATSGSYNPNDTFSFDVNVTANFAASGYSLWLEAPTGLASKITITGETYSTFAGPTDNGFPKAFNDVSGRTNSGFLTDHDTVVNPQTGTMDSGDLGATGAAAAAGTYTVAHITFSLAGAAPGTYTLQSTTASPKGSEVSTTGFASVFSPAATYTITVVPEPGTWSLLGLGGIGSVGLTWLRARRRS